MKIGKQEFRVNETDLNELKAIQKSGTHTTREVKRAEILLHVSEGKSPQEISEWVKRSEGTVYEVCRRYREGGLARALYDGARPGQPPKLDFRQESEITMLACSDAPEGHARWSVRLLRDAVIEWQITDSISREKIRLFLKKMHLSHG